VSCLASCTIHSHFAFNGVAPVFQSVLMSNTVSILVRGSISLVSARDYLESIVGHCFTKSAEVEWNLYETDVLGLHISLFDEPGFVDDSGIAFSQYPLVIDVNIGSLTLENNFEQDWYQLFPAILASMLAKRASCECVVVENLQRITATFTN